VRQMVRLVLNKAGEESNTAVLLAKVQGRLEKLVDMCSVLAMLVIAQMV